MTREEIEKMIKRGYKVVNLRPVKNNEGVRPIQVWLKVFSTGQ